MGREHNDTTARSTQPFLLIRHPKSAFPCARLGHNVVFVPLPVDFAAYSEYQESAVVALVLYLSIRRQMGNQVPNPSKIKKSLV